MLFHWEQSDLAGWNHLVNVIISGLPMDFSMSGYLTAIPGLLLLISVFFTKSLKSILSIYFIIACILISVIFVPDIVLYSYWGFRIDSTIFAYLTSPTEVVASAPIYVTILGILVAAVYAALLFLILKKCIINNFPSRSLEKKIQTSVALILLLGLMFIPIRGGVTTSTMNVSRVYFSENMYLNHSAINPMFNMFYSFKLKDNFKDQYRFMDDNQAHTVFNNLIDYDLKTEVPQLLNTDKPNVILIILESFGAPILEPLGGAKGVAPNLNKLAEEGVFFNNLYASTFRTDRAVVSAIAGYPAQPTMSLLKYTNKIQSLSSIPKSLVDNGYKASFLYGGDVNFAQIKTLFVTQKVTDITTDTDFPIDLRLTKWGVPDAFTFDKFLNDIEKEKEQPYLKMFLTLSSHEPFDVPTNKFDEPYFNSVYYTDSCIGVFIDKLKASPAWKNSLVIFIPDHNMRYPKTIGHFDPARHKSFMLWIGGAIKEPIIINKVCSQIDMAPTLLSQLHIDHSQFPFSKDILNPTAKEFAFYTFPNGFGMITDKGKAVYDCDGKKELIKEGMVADSLMLQGKAMLQCLYDDISNR